MDLGAFAEEVLDAVAGICGDTVVESHEQASHVLEALCRRPGAGQREIAAVFGLSLEQFARSREHTQRCQEGREEELRRKDPVWADLCRSDAVYTWNVLIERINHAAHWREEFREMANAVEIGEETSDDDDEVGSPIAAAVDVAMASPAGVSAQASQQTRAKAREMLSKHLEPAPEALCRRLTQRLDDELFEHCPDDKEYRHAARGLVANLRRNSMLGAGYATGRVPPQWLVHASAEALAPRMRQLTRKIQRAECAKEVKHDDESARVRRQMWEAARGTNLAPPAQAEDPLGRGAPPGAPLSN